MAMSDSEVLDFNYNGEQKEYSPEYFLSWVKRCVDRHYERIEEERELAKTHTYTQVWLMSKAAWESLPDDCTWSDLVMAGAQFIGYKWVKDNE